MIRKRQIKELVTGFAVATILAAIAAVVIFYSNRQSRVKELDRLLRDTSVNISIGGKNYQIVNGRIQETVGDADQLKILSLAAFYQWNKEDPLFDSPDFDPQALQKSLGVLDERQSQYMKHLNLDREFYPISFLQHLADASIETKDFLKGPSEDKAQNLIKAQSYLAEIYRQEAESFIAFEKDAPSHRIVSLNTATNLDIITSDFNKIIDNAGSLQIEIDKRQKCLTSGEGCVRPADNFKKPTDYLGTDYSGGDVLPPETVYNIPASQVQADEIKGPFGTQTACVGWGENFSSPEHYFYSYIHAVDSSGVLIPMNDIELSTDIFFRKISTPLQAFPYYKQLAGQGINYTRTSPTLPYMCLDSGYLNEISEINLFLETQQPLFPKVEQIPGLDSQTKDFLDRAAKAENEFFNGKYQTYQKLLNLSDQYAFAYRIIPNQPDLKQQLLDRYLMIQRKMGRFDLSINKLSLLLPDMTNLVIVNHSTDNDFKLTTYPERIDYGLVYLPFSSSVWRSPVQPDYFDHVLVKNAVSPDGGYISYTQAIKIYPKDTIKTWFATIFPILREEVKQMKQSQ